MRKIEFSELKLKNINNENEFYKFYLKTLEEKTDEKEKFEEPIKKYEICYLNILDGKIVLLNKKYIQKEESIEAETFYDYSIAYKVYNLILDIYESIEDEKNEFNELYKNERMQKGKEIIKLKQQDEELFKKSLEKYNIIINSEIYKRYLKLEEENKKLRIENNMLKEEYNSEIQKNKVGFFKKIINKFKNKRLTE